MDTYNEIIRAIALSMGAAWASGINLYATILVLGALGATQNIVLPEHLHILMNPLVMTSAGLMFVTEFIADKVPGVDTGWDLLHTFIRIPAGAVLAAGAVGEVSPALALTAAILGGGIAAGVHATKTGSRALINMSPEPFSNWTASISEDVIVVAGIWTALNHPLLFIGLFILFIGMVIWLLPRIWRGLKRVFAAVERWVKDRTPSA
ncbi:MULTISPECIES: DUF4126 domain-containing protein [Desulfococcus]|uniref:DUF4126 domain-containing protein n=1 Tax=Desulfococcus multivorans DSM 2059 TaxID=1121405 RepID=S7VFR1_DESML|nr:DUF4126 domain-containing protein [Desulfococcus multivorans]AOY58508.1 conserved uncharacterized protein [Desulfococcus multivorans]AQV00822.1 hypothetical protein B2D07_08600 [Desulfococcus multivorans]EPR43293.1 protein of unknown function DUF4126 [Desulfococcus multivorans DSM 2059]SJZ42213.1 protein of unknown function [Desulfococcus multivorans DSM 2059]